MKKEVAFCFYQFIFKTTSHAAIFGNVVFTIDGYKLLKTTFAYFEKHDGGQASHNISRGSWDDFNNQRANVSTKFHAYNKEAEIKHKNYLSVSLDCVRYVIARREAFCGQDEILQFHRHMQS